MSPIRHSSEDLFWMRRALGLAREMRGRVWPNPPVGCVIVKDGVVVAEAATEPGGRPHAERKALDQAGSHAEGAAIYVTLEPCCHWGKTPPCADGIIDAGISRAVCAVRDPDPRVNGGGFAKLRQAGVAVSVGACADEAERLLSGFFTRIRHGVPEVVVLSEPSSAEASSAPPTGVDALIVSSGGGPRLLAGPGEIDLSGVEPGRLLAHMGAVGLTSVAISDRDPLRPALAAVTPGPSDVPLDIPAYTPLPPQT